MEDEEFRAATFQTFFYPAKIHRRPLGVDTGQEDVEGIPTWRL